MSCNSTKELVKFTPLSVLPYAHALPRRKRGNETDILKESDEEKECNSTNNFTRVKPKVSLSELFEHGLIDVISFDALANNMLSVESEKDQKNTKICSLANTSSAKSRENDHRRRGLRNMAIVNSDNDDNEINNNDYNSSTVMSTEIKDKGIKAYNSNVIDDEKKHAIVTFTDHYDNYDVDTYDDHNNNDSSYDNSRNSSFTLQYLNHIKDESSNEQNEQELHEREEGRVSWGKDGNYSSSKSSTTNRNSRGNKSLIKFWDWRNADSCSFDKVTQNITANASVTHVVNVPATLDATLSMITISNVLHARTASTFTISSSSSAAKRDSDNWESQVEEL